MFYEAANYYEVLIVHKGILEMEEVKPQQISWSKELKSSINTNMH